VASQGPNNPGTGANDTGYGTIAWVNPGNVVSSNDARATAAMSSVLTPTNYLKATNFGFTIPSGATINGIIVEIEKSATAANRIVDDRVRIVKADGTVGTTDKASATNWTGTDTYATYGSSSDLWGESWTDADINDADFGAVIAARWVSGGATETGRVDHVRITVHYTEAAGGIGFEVGQVPI
jgi:hypothetical protein